MHQQKYLEEIGKQNHVIVVEKKGDCLFEACGVQVAAERAIAAEDAVGGGLPHGETRKLYDAMMSMTVEQRRDIASKLRTEVVEDMRKNAVLDDTWDVCTEGSLVYQRLMEVLQRPGPKKGDVTGNYIREEAMQTWKDHGVLTEVFFNSENSEEKSKTLKEHLLADVSTAKNIYCRVMMKSGVYGEQQEMLALSSFLKRPVEVFYWTMSQDHGRGQMIQPMETFGKLEKGKSLPLRVIHRMPEPHYDILLQKHASDEDMIMRENENVDNWDMPGDEGYDHPGHGIDAPDPNTAMPVQPSPEWQRLLRFKRQDLSTREHIMRKLCKLGERWFEGSVEKYIQVRECFVG